MNKTSTLKSKTTGLMTAFTDMRDCILVEKIKGATIVESFRMSREEARDEWSALRAYSVRG